MKAAVLTEAGFEIQEVATPTVGGDEVLVEMLACGVCSGDVFVYQNRADFVQSYNRLGHEPSGRVTAIGRKVTTVQPGDIVTALALPAYSDYFVTTAEKVVKLPDEIDPAYAVGEAIACCVHAANRFGIHQGDKVALLGCGFMGLICLQLAKYKGAGFICAFDPVTERLRMAEKYGADITCDPVQVDHQQILKKHGNFDVVIEATGVQSAIDLSTQLVRQHGRIILIGYHQSNSGLRTVNMQQWNFKAIDIINGHVRRQDEKAAALRQGMELMQQGHIDTRSLVTIYNLEDIEQAFRDLTAGKAGLYKAVLCHKLLNTADHDK